MENITYLISTGIPQKVVFITSKFMNRHKWTKSESEIANQMKGAGKILKED